jgi:hypothetical protein
MEQLKWLMDNCKASVSVTCNIHKDNYESAKAYLTQMDSLIGIREYTSPDVWDKMIAIDTVVEVIAYPETPIGSYRAYHYDIEAAVEAVIYSIKNR